MANIRWTRLGLASLTRAARGREETAAAARGARSSSMGAPGSAGSFPAAPAPAPGGAPAPAGAGARGRRSNSASVMLGRVRPVRLSGPGIPPRRIALLIEIVAAETHTLAGWEEPRPGLW